jgi:hypothetical protein
MLMNNIGYLSNLLSMLNWNCKWVKNERITLKLFISLEQNISCRRLEREKKKEQKLSRHLCTSSKELYECTSSCLLFYQRANFSLNKNTSPYYFLFLGICLVWPYYVFDALPIPFARSFIFFWTLFENEFHMRITHSIVIVIDCDLSIKQMEEKKKYVLDFIMWLNFWFLLNYVITLCRFYYQSSTFF